MHHPENINMLNNRNMDPTFLHYRIHYIILCNSKNQGVGIE